MEATTNSEKWLATLADTGDPPVRATTIKERWLAAIAGFGEPPAEANTKEEKLLKAVYENGGGGTKAEGTLSITENGKCDVTPYAEADVILYPPPFSAGCITEKIALDIYQHSEEDAYNRKYGGGMLESIAFELLNECCTIHVEIEE